MNAMSTTAWKLFLDAAELGSLGKVALLHSTSQPQVSRQIGALELRCGGRLFARTGRGVVLTELGRRIAPKVRAWLASTEALENDILGSAGQPMGRVRLGIIPSVAHPLTSSVLRQMKHMHPLVDIRVREGQGAQLEHWLEDGSLDMAILLQGGIPDDRQALPLAQTDTYLIGWPGERLTSAATVRFSRLDHLPLVSFCRPSRWRDQLDQLARQHSIHLNVQLEADSLAVQVAVVAQGDTYALLGGYAVTDALARGQIQAARVVEPRVNRHAALALSRHGELSLAMRTVMHAIQSVAQDMKKPAKAGFSQSTPRVKPLA
jgi:LysR family transcriptional regulator, nitrogen assimilation regulatory protein